ncbi:hypothetical protein XENOCAPTIV_010450, partial [Xenoophorus captivus]
RTAQDLAGTQMSGLQLMTMGKAMVRRSGPLRKIRRRLLDYFRQKCSVGGGVVCVSFYFRMARSLMVSGMAGVQLKSGVQPGWRCSLACDVMGQCQVEGFPALSPRMAIAAPLPSWLCQSFSPQHDGGTPTG